MAISVEEHGEHADTSGFANQTGDVRD
jgi:hypothetical protein